MAANIFGESGLVWGLSEEVGILAQSYSRDVTSQQQPAKNHEGEDVGLSVYNPIAEHSIEGYITGATGIAAAEVGSVLATIANLITGNGVDGGDVIVTGVTDTLENEDFQSFSVDATQRPLITTP